MILGSTAKIGYKEQILSWWKAGNWIFLRKVRQQKHVSVAWICSTNQQNWGPEFVRAIYYQQQPHYQHDSGFSDQMMTRMTKGVCGFKSPKCSDLCGLLWTGTSTQYVDFSWQGFPRDSHRKAADPNSDKVFTFAGVEGGRQATTSLLVLFNCSLNWLYLPWFHLSPIWFLFRFCSTWNVMPMVPDWDLIWDLALSRFSEKVGQQWFEASKNHSFAVAHLW